MNGQVFAGLYSLKILELFGNKCISQTFRFIDNVEETSKWVKEKCDFCEIDAQELVDLHRLVDTKMREIENLLSDAQKKDAEIVDNRIKIKNLEEKVTMLTNDARWWKDDWNYSK